MLALSAWTWLVGAALGLVAIGTLIVVTIGLIVRIKQLIKSLSAASGEVQGALEEMRVELDQAQEELAELRRRRERDAG